jgi:hypothetical protein
MKQSSGEIIQLKIFRLIFIGLCIVYAILVGGVLGAEGYMPYHEDETINYNSGRLFFETNSLKGEDNQYENVAPVFGSNWYGFFYNVFYGSINKVFGLSSKHIITVNVLLMLLAFWLIYKIDWETSNKFLFGTAILLMPNVAYFLFGYWPVIINLALAVSLAGLIYKLGKAQDELRIRQLKIIYVSLSTAYILVNPLWALWSLGIIPFYKNLKGLILNIAVAGFVILLSFVYSKFLCAPFVTGNTTIMFAYIFSFQIKHFLHLVKANFFDSMGDFFTQNIGFLKQGNYDNAINQFLLLGLLFFSPVYFLVSKNKMYLSITLVSSAIFLALVTVYTPEFEYFQRILTPVYVLLLFGVFGSELKPLKIAVILLLLVSFPFSIKNSMSYIDLRKKMFQEAEHEFKPVIAELDQVKYYINPDKETVIQWAYFEHNMPRAVFMTHLPLSDTKNHPMVYTMKVNCFDPKVCDTIPAAQKFQRYGKLPVNYALSKNKIDLPGYHLLMDRQYIKLYRIDSAYRQK